MSVRVSADRRSFRHRWAGSGPGGFASTAVMALAVVGALAGLAAGAFRLLTGVLTATAHASGGGSDTIAGLATFCLVALAILGVALVESHPIATASLLIAAGMTGFLLSPGAWIVVGPTFLCGAILAVVAWVRSSGRRMAPPPSSAEHWR